MLTLIALSFLKNIISLVCRFSLKELHNGPLKIHLFLMLPDFATLYCTHNKQYSGNCSLPLAKLATRNEWILEVDFLFSRIKDFPRPMSNISYWLCLGEKK